MPKSRSTQRINKTPQYAREPLMKNSTANDICGVFLIVLAFGMGVSLIMPSSAPVANACMVLLEQLFGVGAMLVPVALFLYAITFFLPPQSGLSARCAIGLFLIVSAILGIISINYPLALDNVDILFAEDVCRICGGVWGGAIAWVLLKYLGFAIGMVILVGIIIAGVVVCGFSISSFVQKLRDASIAAKEELEARAARNANDKPKKEKGSKHKKVVNPETSFIGDRKTHVLKRDEVEHQKKHPPLESFVEDNNIIPIETIEAEPFAEETKVLRRKATKRNDASTASVDTSDEGAAPTELIDANIRGEVNDNAIAKAPKTKEIERPGDKNNDFKLPSMSCLKSNPNSASSASSETELKHTAERLQATLIEFGLKSKVKGWVSGPLVTTFKIEMGEGERVNKITNLEDDIALSLASSSVRIFAPIPGTSLVGIEIPNSKRTNVCLGDVLPYATGGPLTMAIGRDAEGVPVLKDLSTMPHMLIAGATGSGKSVMINSIIMSILMRATPDQVRLIMIDPKRVELGGYNGLPHLYVPVVTEPKQAASALQWAVVEMERRLKVFQKAGARDIGVYNSLIEKGKLKDDDGEPLDKIPYLVIIVDELSDLMMVAGKDVEASIVRIAQLARAAGIHLIVATQRPSADVVTGLIKSNIDNRIAFAVASGTDSRVILDQMGAERLLGRGDMLMKLRGAKSIRVLGAYVSDPEIDSVVKFICAQSKAEYHDEILSAVLPSEASNSIDMRDDDTDPLLWEAAELVVKSNLGSTSSLQRNLRVGYARAGRIMDMLEHKGIVGPASGSKPRDVLMTYDELITLKEEEQKLEE